MTLWISNGLSSGLFFRTSRGACRASTPTCAERRLLGAAHGRADVLTRIAEHPFQRPDGLLTWNWDRAQADDILAA